MGDANDGESGPLILVEEPTALDDARRAFQRGLLLCALMAIVPGFIAYSIYDDLSTSFWLADNGERVTATVLDTRREFRSEAVTAVGFELQGQQYVGEFWSGGLRKGSDVAIFVNPENPAEVRRVDRVNVATFEIVFGAIWLVGGGVLLLELMMCDRWRELQRRKRQAAASS